MKKGKTPETEKVERLPYPPRPWAAKCCSKAKVNPCVCRAYYSCPVHESKHWGTHD